MRTWSVSQQKFIDSPDGSGGSTAPAMGGDNKKLKAAFLLKMMQNPKQQGYYQKLYDFMAPEEEQKETAEIRNRRAAIQPAQSLLNQVSEMNLPKGGPLSLFNIPQETSLKHFGGWGVSKEKQDLNSKYQLLKQNVVRAFQGARMSDKDIEMALEYIPTIRDTEQNARVKLETLRKTLEDIERASSVHRLPSATTNYLNESESEWE